MPLSSKHSLLISLAALVACDPPEEPSVAPEPLRVRVQDDPSLPPLLPVDRGYLTSTRPLVAQFSDAGVSVQPHASQTPVHLYFGGISRTEAYTPLPQILPRPGMADRLGFLEYDRGEIVEWWRVSHSGLQQGWDIGSRPEGDGPLLLHVELEGASAERVDDEIWITTEDGHTLSYGDVYAWDALGEHLPAILETDGVEITVAVDDTEALYPITIDPWMSTKVWSRTGSQGTYFGFSVLMAGDLNKDGYQDVAVGAPVESNNIGEVYVYFGCSVANCPEGVSTSYTRLNPSIGAYFGWALAAGDFNGDSYGDLAVSTPYYTGGQFANSGRVQIFTGSAAGLNTTAWWTHDPFVANMIYGTALAAGDFNADGYDDLVVGAPYTSTPQVDIWKGGSSSMSLARTLTGMSGSHFGYSLATGYNNLDVYADLLIGSPQEPGAGQNMGVAHFYRSDGASGIPAAADYTVSGTEEGSRFGHAVAISTDTNGDDLGDLAIGAPYQDRASRADTGSVFLYSGKLDDSLLDTMFATEEYAQLGFSVARAGDINGDGYGDLIVGAPNLDDGYEDEGAALAFESDGAGIMSRATVEYGKVAGAAQGYSVSAGADVNLDGYPDAMVGVPYLDQGSGRAKIFLGGVDVDGDGYTASEDCNDKNGSINPSATEIAGDNIDQNCDGYEICYVDADNDNHREMTGTSYTSKDSDCNDSGEGLASDPMDDCNDKSATIYTGATEQVADGIDQDCDTVDSCYTDADNDGYGTAVVIDGLSLSCLNDANRATVSTDCDDGSATDYPGATETVANNDDEDCDGVDSCYTDTDNDGYGTAVVIDGLTTNCVADANRAAVATDCDDASAEDYPGAPLITADVNNGDDDDCDGNEECYTDVDDDNYGTTTIINSGDMDCLDANEATVSTDCDDASAEVYPGAPLTAVDVNNGDDDDCDGKEECYTDVDDDNYGISTIINSGDMDCSDANEAVNSTDCNDSSASINPGASETVGDGVDQNCDSVDSCYTDTDNDNYGTAVVLNGLSLSCANDSGRAPVSGDCNDALSTISPVGTETVGDGIDQDCDNVDSCYTDTDNDNYGTAVVIDGLTLSCTTDAGRAGTNGDCNDASASVYPNAAESVGDGVDQDCDNVDSCYTDTDNDNYGTAVVIDGATLNCSTDANRAPVSGDCNDGNSSIKPGATETIGDGIDQDCDTKETCYTDADNDGHRPNGTATTLSADSDCSDNFEAISSDPTADCDDNNAAVNPAATEIVANGVDENCDTKELCYTDADYDGYGADSTTANADLTCSISGLSGTDDDCDDSLFGVNPGATEVCNGSDDDCDTVIDSDAAGQQTWYLDADNDNYGVSGTATTACSAPLGYVLFPGDCNDSDDDIHPGAIEDCQAVDDLNCDGSVGFTDADGDGFAACEECDDNDDNVNPDADELCNQYDDNCDGEIDENTAVDTFTWYVDSDNDGFGLEDETVQACVEPEGAAGIAGDCNDQDESVFPGAPEPDCSDPTDYNCDGVVAFEDNDGDGFAACVDCNDDNDDVYPDAPELCNEIDDDCDEVIDGPDALGGPNWYTDADEDGYGDESTAVASCEPVDGRIAEGGDCNDGDAAFHPGATEGDCTDPADYNCDGSSGFTDADADGFAACEDCNDDQEIIFPGATEKCGNGLDDNCDGAVDENCDSDPDEANCSCASTPTPPALGLLATLGTLWFRRRRKSV